MNDLVPFEDAVPLLSDERDFDWACLGLEMGVAVAETKAAGSEAAQTGPPMADGAETGQQAAALTEQEQQSLLNGLSSDSLFQRQSPDTVERNAAFVQALLAKPDDACQPQACDPNTPHLPLRSPPRSPPPDDDSQPPVSDDQVQHQESPPKRGKGRKRKLRVSLETKSGGKRSRRFTEEQRTQLENYFAQDTNPSPTTSDFIASQIGLQRKQVKTWFTNRRQREKRLSKAKEAEDAQSGSDSDPL